MVSYDIFSMVIVILLVVIVWLLMRGQGEAEAWKRLAITQGEALVRLRKDYEQVCDVCGRQDKYNRELLGRIWRLRKQRSNRQIDVYFSEN